MSTNDEQEKNAHNALQRNHSCKLVYYLYITCYYVIGYDIVDTI